MNKWRVPTMVSFGAFLEFVSLQERQEIPCGMQGTNFIELFLVILQLHFSNKFYIIFPKKKKKSLSELLTSYYVTLRGNFCPTGQFVPRVSLIYTDFEGKEEDQFVVIIVFRYKLHTLILLKNQFSTITSYSLNSIQSSNSQLLTLFNSILKLLTLKFVFFFLVLFFAYYLFWRFF